MIDGMGTQQKPAILSLGTALPPYRCAQDTIAENIAIISGLNDKESRWLKKLYRNSDIQYRHSVVEAFAREVDHWQIFNHHKPLSTAARNAIYKAQAPQLSYKAAQQAMALWGGKPAAITHIIYVSCTGVMTPGVQSHLQKMLSLQPNINQVGLNMMGCFGAFKGLDLANAYAQQNAQHRILLVCCELCTLHLQANNNPEHQVGNALFADGAAACVVGIPGIQEPSLYNIEKTASYCLPETADKMTWEIADTGFVMGIKPDIPEYIERHAMSFVKNLLPATIEPQECLWPVHPGGKQILYAVQKAFGLSKKQLASSWEILQQCGNMSSATFLFVLAHMQQQKKSSPWAIGLGFGPGLMLEGILLNISVL